MRISDTKKLAKPHPLRRPAEKERALLGLGSAVGLVVANMVGAGVFLSAGFMAQDLGPLPILVTWALGLFLAMCGALGYAKVAELVPRSGGEYRYLSELLHPALGYLAGWASMLVGFSGPVAIDALAAGSFAKTLIPAVEPRVFGSAVIVITSVVHATNLRASRWGQNALVLAKVVLLIGFAAACLGFGSWRWPTWEPPNGSGFSLPAVGTALFYVAFAFSGYNAAIYAAEELRSPRHTLPRALLIGCSAVGVLYLLINWEFISNLTPKRVSAVFAYEETRVTLAHLIASDLFGKTGGRLVSFLLIVVFCSAASAMSFLGPRVVSEMAKDGFLPGALAARGDGPPRGAVLLQAMLALVILWTQPFQHVVHDVGAILTLFSALTLLGLFRRRPRVEQSSIRIHRVAAAVFIASAAGMLYYGFRAKTQLVLWICAVAGAALLGYWGSRAAKRPIR